MENAILILDDERGILDVMRAHLVEQGYPCTAETSPVRALDALRAGAYALLITDLRMPEMNGMEVVTQAKKLDPDIAIVVVTAIQEVGNAIDAMHAGADDYVVKPFNLSEIGIAASRALEKRTLVLQNRRYQENLEHRVHEAAEDLEHVNAELLGTKQYLESLIHSTVDAIITTDTGDRIEFVNEGACRMLGYVQDELKDSAVAMLYAGGEDEVEYVRRKLRENDTVQDYETELVRKSGSKVPVNVSLSCVREADGVVRSILAVCKDITRQKQLEHELKELSVKDSLTGLYNQRSFYDRLEEEIERAQRQGHPLSLLLFDIDEFKTFNDSLGHLEGDRVLQAVGQVVMNSTREHVDIGFRYGGDEFTVILPEADEAQARHIAERIRQGFHAREFKDLTVSIGLMTYREDLNLKSFIHLTDAMMYEAKRAGGNQVRVYSPTDVPTEATKESQEA